LLKIIHLLAARNHSIKASQHHRLASQALPKPNNRYERSNVIQNMPSV